MKINTIRHEIDMIDSDIIELLSKRSTLVSAAGKTKKNRDQVSDRDRVEKVIAKVKARAEKAGLDPSTAEMIYRNIINCFIQKEMKEFTASSCELQDI